MFDLSVELVSWNESEERGDIWADVRVTARGWLVPNGGREQMTADVRLIFSPDGRASHVCACPRSCPDAPGRVLDCWVCEYALEETLKHLPFLVGAEVDRYPGFSVGARFRIYDRFQKLESMRYAFFAAFMKMFVVKTWEVLATRGIKGPTTEEVIRAAEKLRARARRDQPIST